LFFWCKVAITGALSAVLDPAAIPALVTGRGVFAPKSGGSPLCAGQQAHLVSHLQSPHIPAHLGYSPTALVACGSEKPHTQFLLSAPGREKNTEWVRLHHCTMLAGTPAGQPSQTSPTWDERQVLFLLILALNPAALQSAEDECHLTAVLPSTKKCSFAQCDAPSKSDRVAKWAKDLLERVCKVKAGCDDLDPHAVGWERRWGRLLHNSQGRVGSSISRIAELLTLQNFYGPWAFHGGLA
jgi:hypothetical protein